MQEIWKDIAEYEGLYRISSCGKVQSVFTGQIMKQEHLKNGYLRVCLYKNKKSKHKLVHRLVAEAFIENPELLAEVNHINGNKKDNSVENLEWTTHKENIRHAFENGLAGGSVFMNNKGSKKVVQYNENMEKLMCYPSMHEASRQTGIPQGRISSSVHKGYKAGGFYWKTT